MRRTLLSVFVVLISIATFAQSTSPEGLYERGMDAISGAGPSRNDRDALEYFRRSAELGFGPSQVALGYFSKPASSLPAARARPWIGTEKAANQG